MKYNALIINKDYINHLSDPKDENNFNTKLWYINNLNKVPIPDPQVFVEDGMYYIVGTTDGNISIIDCFTTTDFVNFNRVKAIYDPALYNGWESNKPAIFAAEMYKIEGKYYLYYSALAKDNIRYCSVVEAHTPLGPYKPIVNEEVDGLNNPIFKELGKNLLDATIFIDDDNSIYMYLVQEGKLQYITGVKMKNPYTPVKNTYKKLLIPGYIRPTDAEQKLYWELFRNCEYKINEAPFMLKNNGKYYMTYSVNGCWNKYYNICYAICDSPLGYFIKPYEEGKIWTNLLMGYPGDTDSESLLAKQWEGFASGTAHHSFFKVGEEVMVAYHGHANRGWNNENWAARYVAFDYLYFDQKGAPFINGPTYSLQPLPSLLTGYYNIAKKALVKTKNVINEKYINDDYIASYYNLNNPDTSEVILGKGKSLIEFEFDKEYLIRSLLIYNSSYYDKIVKNIEYIDFGNDQKIYNAEFNLKYYTKKDLQFVYPNSAITIELLNEIKSNMITICFNLKNGGQINEIKILGK